jgi:hypothetical protein
MSTQRPAASTRTLVLSGALFVLNLAFQFSQSKGWFSQVPNWIVVVLWVVPLFPLGWWACTHETTIRLRDLVVARFKFHPISTAIIVISLAIVVVVSVTVGAYKTWSLVRPAKTNSLLIGRARPPDSTPQPKPPVLAAPDSSKSGVATVNPIRTIKPESPPRTLIHASNSQQVHPSTPTIPQAAVNNCPDGICISGGTLNGNPTVNNLSSNYGTLKERLLQLGQEMMDEMFMYGLSPIHGSYTPSPNLHIVTTEPLGREHPEELSQWKRSISTHFRFKFYDQVLKIRDECAEIHIRDNGLDHVLDNLERQDQIDKLSTISSFDIQEIAERLKVMANQISQEQGK